MTGKARDLQKFSVAVHLILLNGGDEILLLRRFNTGFRDGEYGLVAGHVEKGENLKDAMIREAREEVGISISERDLEVVGAIPNLPNGYVYFFLHSNNWKGDVTNLEPHKCDDLRWTKITELPMNTVNYVKCAVENYLLGKWFSEVEVKDVP